MKNSDYHIDSLFMKRAVELASLGIGYVSPNPLVGSVVVHDGKIIGEGWHKKYGEAHAEVNAIQAVADKALLNQSTVYVNLEPCAHFGKTPPCADMLIAHHVKKVVVANVDSNPQVAGNGIRKLRSAGIEVITGVLEKEGSALNRRFFTFMEKQRPYIILKWAQTSDGFVARQNYDSKWISNEYARQQVHKWRTVEDAILIGTKTAMHDNPSLNVRDWSGRNPVRIVIDKYLTLDHKLHLFDETQRSIFYNVLKDEERPNVSLIKISEENFVSALLEDLYKQKIQSVIVEGGAYTLNNFMEAGLWDEARIFTSRATFQQGIKAPILHGILIKQENMMNDTLSWYKREAN